MPPNQGPPSLQLSLADNDSDGAAPFDNEEDSEMAASFGSGQRRLRCALLG